MEAHLIVIRYSQPDLILGRGPTQPILDKSENATPKLFDIYIYKIMQTKNVNESVS